MQLNKPQGAAIANLSRLSKSIERVGLVLHGEDGVLYVADRKEYLDALNSNEKLTGREAFLRCTTCRPLNIEPIMVVPKSRKGVSS
jgi:hypothetical protein